LNNPPDRPLRGIRIALDPGHIGGRWARVEERFIVGARDQWFVQEAALNLHVARLIRKKLEAAGATVLMTRDGFEPVTDLRPDDYTETVEREMEDFERFDHLPDAMREADRLDQMQKRREFLFYRRAEIQARADLVNEKLKPDLALCIHFNAVDVRPPETWTTDNRLVVFVSGNYLPGEIAIPEQRAALFGKILGGVSAIERAAAVDLAAALADSTGLPAGGGGPGPRVGTNDYVVARNLAANRLFRCPVVFLEAYYMNNAVVFARLQAGDYDGEREIAGRRYRSIYRDYADGAADGVIAFYRKHTVRK
jgi:N-acetylmuramoyl-L-alanine amidase